MWCGLNLCKFDDLQTGLNFCCTTIRLCNCLKRAWTCLRTAVDCVRNVMAHAQKPDFIFRRNGRVHLNRRGASVQSTAGSRGVRISGSNARYTMLRVSVKDTGYSLHSSISPSLPLPCVTVCHHTSIGLYHVTSSSLILIPFASSFQNAAYTY